MTTTSKIPQAGPVALDGTDRAILAALMEDGRMTNAALAARVGVAESTCAYRVQGAAGVGRDRQHQRPRRSRRDRPPDPGRHPVHLSSHSRVHINELLDRLVALPGALSVVHVAGDNDFHVHVAVASPERLRDLILEHITSHPAVTKTETQLVFEVREGRGVLGPL